LSDKCFRWRQCKPELLAEGLGVPVPLSVSVNVELAVVSHSSAHDLNTLKPGKELKVNVTVAGADGLPEVSIKVGAAVYPK